MNPDKKAPQGFLKNFKNMQKIIQFLREASAELSRVAWPTRQQTVHYTVLVIMISVSAAIFLGILDYFFGFGVGEFLSGGSEAVVPTEVPAVVTPEDIAIDSGSTEVQAETPTEVVVDSESVEDTVTVLEEETN